MDAQAYQALHASAAHIFAQMERAADPVLASPGSHEALRQLITRLRIHLESLQGVLKILPANASQDALGQFQPMKTFAYIAEWSTYMIGSVLEFTKILPFKSSVIKEAKVLHRDLKSITAQLDELAYSSLGVGKEAETYMLTHVGGSRLVYPFGAWVEPDGDGFIARCREVPQVYGFGANYDGALTMLTTELTTLRDELMASDDFTDEYLSVKKLFRIASQG